jgi:predicted glycogen debranching enzyme
MIERVEKIQASSEGDGSLDSLLSREWLVTNGLGGYASGTIAGVITRGFHGYLVAALPAPRGRVMMFNDLVEGLKLPGGRVVRLGGEERADAPLELHGVDFLKEFRLQMGLPIWRYEVDGFVLEKRLVMTRGQNTVFIRYRLLEGTGELHLLLRPSLNIRPHNTPVDTPIVTPYTLTVYEDQYEILAEPDLPALRMLLVGSGGALVVDRKRIHEVVYRIEQSRGYAARGELWSPGYFQTELSLGHDATLVASTEVWEVIRALSPAEALSAECERRRRLLAEAPDKARDGFGAELVLAADQFLIRPTGRLADTARAHAAGHEVRSVIAGYPWFTDWGRDTMISLEGLTLSTGRFIEASYILRTFAHYIKDGLIPNLFPEGKQEGLYHTADATLWFFHAIDRYVVVTGDEAILRYLLPKLLDIAEAHLRGTRFGIHVDPHDHLLVQGQEGYQLTWMDAKVDGWVVTPRRGKAVEINALWYNALKLLEGWLCQAGRDTDAGGFASEAAQMRESFNARFWSEELGYLFDVVDGENGKDDPSCRPNQLLAISLRHPILNEAYWGPVVDVCRERLLTPVGLRSLAPGSPDFKAKYDGDLRSRDAAYHQGTVWTWLIGPFIDAWLKVHPGDLAGARAFLAGFPPDLSEACIGSISEIFDADPPFTPRGCVAQAWSVAEVLRCWVKTVE